MADNFIDDLLEKLISIVSPRDAEGKVIAGDKEAATLLEEVKTKPLYPHAQTVLSAAEKRPESVTVYGSENAVIPKYTPESKSFEAKPDNPELEWLMKQMPNRGYYFPTEQKLYVNTDIYRKYSETARQYTFIHELGHFLHILNADPAEAKKIEGLDREDIANLLALRQTPKDRQMQPKQTKAFEELWKSVFGFGFTPKYAKEQYDYIEKEKRR